MKKILLVEDDLILIKMYVAEFRFNGFEVKTAVDGEEGLKLALEEHPDLILLDIKMPKMDGLTMLKNLRNDGWGKHVPVFMLTNLNDSKSVSDSMGSLAQRYFVKSDWDPQQIVDEAKTTLRIT